MLDGFYYHSATRHSIQTTGCTIINTYHIDLQKQSAHSLFAQGAMKYSQRLTRYSHPKQILSKCIYISFITIASNVAVEIIHYQLSDLE